jgi:branched-chain amino acid transport system substrate-binding protein
MGTTDFAPFLAQIPSSGVDAVWAMFLGQDAIGFVKQYDQLGFKARIPLTGSAGLVYEPLLPAMGRSAVGVQIPTWYTPDFPGDVNKRFVDAYTAQYKTAPGSATAGAYVGAMALAKAIEAVGGKVENKNELLAALRKVNLPSTPQGPFRFDDKQNVIFNLSLVKIVDRSGKYIPELVAPIASNVDQSWAAR